MTMFQLDPELEAFRQEVRKFAEKAFGGKAAYWDEKEEFPAENRDLLAKLGYLGMVIPEQYGGSGAPIIQGTVFLEEIARVCFNTGLVCQLALNGPSRAIAILGNAYIATGLAAASMVFYRERFLPLKRGEQTQTTQSSPL